MPLSRMDRRRLGSPLRPVQGLSKGTGPFLEAIAEAFGKLVLLQLRSNLGRLHAALGYMTPATWHSGQPDEVRDERARRIAAARAHRRMTNRQRFTEAALAVRVSLLGSSILSELT